MVVILLIIIPTNNHWLFDYFTFHFTKSYEVILIANCGLILPWLCEIEPSTYTRTSNIILHNSHIVKVFSCCNVLRNKEMCLLYYIKAGLESKAYFNLPIKHISIVSIWNKKVFCICINIIAIWLCYCYITFNCSQ